MPTINSPRLGTTRLSGTPVWQCSKCGRKYQTKAQAKSHEIKVHNAE